MTIHATGRRLLHSFVLCAVAIAISASALAETVVFDDFSDGSATDGEPARWSMAFGGTQTVEDGSLVITALSPTFPASRLVTPIANFTDISVRTQMRLLEGEMIGFGVRYNPDGDDRGTYGGFIDGDMAVIGIGGNAGELFAEAPIDLDVKNEDVMLQFDVFGDSLELWVWPVGAAMPAAPTATAVNDEELAGRMFVWASLGNSVGSESSAAFRFIHVSTTPIRDTAVGDFNADGQLDVEDIDMLTTAAASNPFDLKYDLNDDQIVTTGDVEIWVRDLRKTWVGDANVDGEFNTKDLVDVLTIGKYETGAFAVWSEGDWDADGKFGTSDFVAALIDGGYDLGERNDVTAVPEPGAWVLCLVASVLYLWGTRR